MAPSTCTFVCLLTFLSFVIFTTQNPLPSAPGLSDIISSNNNTEITTTRRPCSIFAKTSCICTLRFSPLCGSDGITYTNMCQFNCAQKCKPGLTIAKCGHCWQKNNSNKSCRPITPNTTT